MYGPLSCIFRISVNIILTVSQPERAPGHLDLSMNYTQNAPSVYNKLHCSSEPKMPSLSPPLHPTRCAQHFHIRLIHHASRARQHRFWTHFATGTPARYPHPASRGLICALYRLCCRARGASSIVSNPSPSFPRASPNDSRVQQRGFWTRSSRAPTVRTFLHHAYKGV